MFPFEFTVLGPPLSHQTRNRKRLAAWREAVRDAANAAWVSMTPTNKALRIVLPYYHEGESVRIDNDNLLKPIQDSLIGLVYEDDRQITDTTVRKTNIDTPVRVRGMSQILFEGLAVGRSFVHVRLEDAPDHSDLIREESCSVPNWNPSPINIAPTATM